MAFNKRLRLFILYYLTVWFGVGLFVYFDIFSAQSQLVESTLSFVFQTDLATVTHLSVWWMIGICFIASILPALILLTFNNRTSLFFFIIILVSSGIGWCVGLQQYNLVLPIVYLLGSFGIGVLVGVFLKMIYSSSEKDFLRAAFTQFVSEDMLKELLKDPNRLRLTGKEHDITVMFLDIRGFTAFSEKKSPAIVVNRLSELLEIVTQLIIKHDGTVDKYIGDAVMAFWGAPTADKKQTSKALRAAIEIRKKIEHDTDFRVGVGINYGKAIIGNIGSSKRFDYTAIGDTVNTASRLEGLTKTLGQSIVVSESVLKKVGEEKSSFDTDDLGQVLVKGKNTKLHVYGLR
ncbi:MAG: adenylate/guanylate cyclase domain-containing protein [Patescibacteria group bacterium]